ncbi:MAG: serine hydrolase domain-containing protein [Pirellulales bacterium]
MSRMTLVALLALFCSQVAAQVEAQESAQVAVWDQAKLAEISSSMKKFVDEGKIAGAVTLIADKDKVVQVDVVALADVASNRPMRRDTIFRIASMTKNVTAMALLRLVALGKLRMDDHVSKYIPAFANPKLKSGEAARDVTIAEVVMHSAGLAGSSGLSGDRTLEAEVNAIGAKPLEFAPGTKWQYSSGLTVAGRLIEIASGQEYAEHLRATIFEPLGMKDTTFTLTAAQAQRLATTYRPGSAPGTLEAVEIPDPTVKRMPNPSGGLYSTADDMAKFYQASLKCLESTEVATAKGQLLDTKLASQMLQKQSGDLVTGFTPGNAWGWGWCVVQQPQSVTRLLSPGTFGHGGAWGTQGWVDPKRDMILVLMIQRSNFGNSDGSDVRDAFNEAAITAYRGESHPTAKFTKYLGYEKAVELKMGETKAVLCPEAGGRVLEYSVGGENLMFIDEYEKNWTPGKATPQSAGRFDFGPEMVVPRHQSIWQGPWSAEVTGPESARLVSKRDESSGVQLMREFTLKSNVLPPSSAKVQRLQGATLICKQTIMNISDKTVEFCHWGRSFSPGGGICLIPLGDRPSRFPSKYVMYEDNGINAKNQDEQIIQRDGFLEILAAPRKPKLGFDSYAGWLAYVLPTNQVFIKRFQTDPDRVYNEAAGLTISVWYPKTGGMIELEPIGPRERLAPGQVASFTEEWMVGQYNFPQAGEKIDLKEISDIVDPPAKGTR